MKHNLRTEADARAILAYFNGFHDGFVRGVTLTSRDWFSQEGSEVTDIAHNLTGQFDVVLDVAHYNYQAGTQPHDRIVHCVFRKVQNFVLDLRDIQPYEWPLRLVEITPSAERYALTLSWAHLVGEEWSTRSKRIFTFASAEFDERRVERSET